MNKNKDKAQFYKAVMLKIDYFSIFSKNNCMKNRSWHHKPNNKAKIFNASDDYVEKRLDK